MEVEILMFEEIRDLELAIDVDKDKQSLRYSVYFKRLEVVEGRLLKAEYGRGKTIDEAMQNYCVAISNKRVKYTQRIGVLENDVYMELPKLIYNNLKFV